MESNAAARAKRLIWFVLLLSLAAPALALQIPPHQGYVNDYAGMLSPATRRQLEQALQDFDRTDSTQVAVLTVKSLESESIEDFSIRVVDDWQVGQRGRDNGVLLLIAEKERKVRIEVGRGLEGILTDLAAGRIIDNIITPLFKQGRYDEGVTAGVGAVVKSVRGEYSADEPGRQDSGEERMSFISFLFIAAILISALGNISRPLAAGAGAVALPLLVFLVLAVPFGLILLLILMPAGALLGLFAAAVVKGGGRRTGGYYLGGGYGGSSGGGGFSSGGFGGFGGGSFGGGGASGGW